MFLFKNVIVRENEASFTNKVLKKAIMKRSQLTNVFLKKGKRTLKSHAAYNKQGNYCTSFLWKEKQNCFETVDPSKITDNNKMFWKTVKPMFSNICAKQRSITLVKDAENLEVTKTFNVFFSSILKEMSISFGQELLTEADDIEDQALRIIVRLKKASYCGCYIRKT